VAALFSESGIITMVTLISPYRKDRDAARALHESQGIPFMEVFMDVPLSVVKARTREIWIASTRPSCTRPEEFHSTLALGQPGRNSIEFDSQL